MRHNGRPALKASQIRSTHITLHPSEPVTVVCTDCGTWRKLTRSMIPAHRSTDLGRDLLGADGRQIRRDARCPGSGQRIEMDLMVARWVTQVEDGLAEVAARRPTTVLRKVPTPKPPALHQLAPAAPTADTARAAFYSHSARCAGRKDKTTREDSTTGCSGTRLCTDGARLYATYLQLLRQEPERLAAQARAEQEQREQSEEDTIQADEQLRRRQALWAERSQQPDHDAWVRKIEPLVGHPDSRRRLFGPQLPSQGYTTQEASLALAARRTEAAVREASPVRRNFSAA
ncbi:hypothetical protein [Kitasatospora sp. NPDC001527]|uniref:hypothetical protein n=1 Tax=Kitasatospora sp. NPDC001527 TaxID=3154519 RepID=UPI00332C603B